MSATPQALACQLEDLKQLDSKPYIKFQTHLLNHVLDELPRTLAVLYEKLYIKQKTDKRHAHGVVMSQRQIGKLIHRHESTAYRQLKQLESLGYIRKMLSKYSKNLYRNQLCYEVVAPEEILSGIKNNVLDITRNDILYKRSPAKMHEDPCENAGHIKNNRNNPKAYIKTNIREESLPDNFEPVDEAIELSDIFLNEPTTANVPQGTQTQPIAEPQPENFKPVESDTFKTQAEVARFITKAERDEVVKKVKAMKRDGEIHAKVQTNYADIMILVKHIITHCMYGWKYKNFKHALNSAAKGLRNGTWTTPKRVVRDETLECERLHNEAKERERRLLLDSHVARTLGEAMRLTHGPSEADVGKLKAEAICDVVQAVGEHKAKNYRQVIDDMLKKAIEQKNEKMRK